MENKSKMKIIFLIALPFVESLIAKDFSANCLDFFYQGTVPKGISNDINTIDICHHSENGVADKPFYYATKYDIKFHIPWYSAYRLDKFPGIWQGEMPGNARPIFFMNHEIAKNKANTDSREILKIKGIIKEMLRRHDEEMVRRYDEITTVGLQKRTQNVNEKIIKTVNTKKIKSKLVMMFLNHSISFIKNKIAEVGCLNISGEIEKEFGDKLDMGNVTELKNALCDLVKSHQPKHADFTNSSFDRGHLFPALYASTDKYFWKSSFCIINAAPQAQNFNRNEWKNSEKKILETMRKECNFSNAKRYLITGVIPGKAYLNTSDILIPTHFYTAACCESTEGIGWSFAAMGNNTNESKVEFMSVTKLTSILKQKFQNDTSIFSTVTLQNGQKNVECSFGNDTYILQKVNNAEHRHDEL